MADGRHAERVDFSENLFWDTDHETLDYEKHKKFIVQRVLEYGSLSDWRLICSFYGINVIIDAAQSLRSLDEKALSFLSAVGNVPVESFRCYTLKQSNPKHWIS